MTIPAIDSAYLVEFLVRLLNIPSPTGYTAQAIEFCEQKFGVFPVELTHNRKGALIATWQGKSSAAQRGLTAHVDTLGGMVKEIKPNGRLKLSKLGGFAWNTVEGEGVTIFTAAGEQRRGSFLLAKASGHVYGAAVMESKREDDTMEVRLDERTNSYDETRSFGIQVGDFVAFDPRVETRNGFIRSRHLDDKACVACIAAAFKALKDAGLTPARTATALIANFEEVGHGAAAGLPAELAELVTVDMAAVGEGQTSDEYHASICVKDSGGPYHHGLSQKLRRLAEAENIPYRIDIYPYYGSDGEAFWRAGGDVAVALIGPGVDASHNYERTHLEALIATTQWILAYLLDA
jgi:putative aminopeptidase FrvX